jgi:hypothetical protein
MQHHIVTGRNLTYNDLQKLPFLSELPTLYNDQPLQARDSSISWTMLQQAQPAASCGATTWSVSQQLLGCPMYLGVAGSSCRTCNVSQPCLDVPALQVQSSGGDVKLTATSRQVSTVQQVQVSSCSGNIIAHEVDVVRRQMECWQ